MTPAGLSDASGQTIAPSPNAPDDMHLTASDRITRDEGFKKLARAGIFPGQDTVQFQDYEPTPGTTWKQHPHINGKPCPFRLEPSPGAIVLLRKQKPDRTTDGIFLPESHQEPNTNRFAIVVAVGPRFLNEHGVWQEPPNLRTGDEIVISKSFMVEPDGKEWPMVTVPFDCYLAKVLRIRVTSTTSGPTVTTAAMH